MFQKNVQLGVLIALLIPMQTFTMLDFMRNSCDKIGQFLDKFVAEVEEEDAEQEVRQTEGVEFESTSTVMPAPSMVAISQDMIDRALETYAYLLILEHMAKEASKSNAQKEILKNDSKKRVVPKLNFSKLKIKPTPIQEFLEQQLKHEPVQPKSPYGSETETYKQDQPLTPKSQNSIFSSSTSTADLEELFSSSRFFRTKSNDCIEPVAASTIRRSHPSGYDSDTKDWVKVERVSS
jgi:hypothetical protein